MSSEFMPMALDSLARQQSARAAGSGASSRITEEELEELGIPVNKPGENDMGLDFNDFLQLMVQQLQNQTAARAAYCLSRTEKSFISCIAAHTRATRCFRRFPIH